jgi:branched-chain amino acid transport system ATP-binding protein
LYLKITDVSIFYDTAQVLNKVNLQVGEGELVSLVGPNGAGKTTLLRTIAGLVKWQKDNLKGTKLGRITIEGTVTFDGVPIGNTPAHKIAGMGLVLCPERGQPFQEMTIKENLLAGAYLYKDKQLIEESLGKVYSLFPILKARQNQVSGTISGGERTMLAIGRALMTQAKLLLIDEPSTGLAPKLRDELFERLSEIHGMGLTILLVEQDVSYALQVSSRNYVISKGHIVSEGTAQDLLSDEFLRKTYLGL